MACWSQLTVEGIPLGRLMDTDPAWAGLDLDQAEEETRRAGWGILTGKGSTEFGIGAAMAEIIGAIQGDEGRVLPVSVPTEGDWGVFMSLPCVLGRGGAEKTLAPDLAPEEQKKLAASCQRLAEVWNQTVEGK